MKKMLSFAVLLAFTILVPGAAFAEDTSGGATPPVTGADTGYNLRNSPNNPRVNYPGDYWDTVRSRNGIRAYGDTNATGGRRFSLGWLGLLGLIGLAGRASKARER